MRIVASLAIAVSVVLIMGNVTACGTDGHSYGIESLTSNTELRLMVGFEMIPGSDKQAIALTKFVAYLIDLDEPSGTTGDPESLVIFADLRHLIPESASVEEGLLGVAFSPTFADDHRVYFHYTAASADPPPGLSVIGRFLVTERGIVADGAQPEVILEVSQPGLAHNGGQLAFGPDGLLHIGLGEGHRPRTPGGNSQDLSNFLGSILRIDVSGDLGYTIPPDNPFVDNPGALAEIYAYGFRNPWRFSFDQETGDLWVGDVGESSWEEVNRIVSGGNYGWMLMEGPDCFPPSVDACESRGLEPPWAVYANEGEDGNCAVITGFVYRGLAMPELDGFLVYGDFCSGTIWAVDTESESQPFVLAETEIMLTSFGALPDGELAVVSWSRGIYRLVKLD